MDNVHIQAELFWERQRHRYVDLLTIAYLTSVKSIAKHACWLTEQFCSSILPLTAFIDTHVGQMPGSESCLPCIDTAV